MYHSVIKHLAKFRFGIQFSWVSFLLLIIFIFLSSFHLMAQGNLLISPHRVVFEGQKRIMEVNLANTGQDSAKYSISFLQYRMTADGAYEEITEPDPGQNFADKYIRVFPRAVMLGPNESQVVKLQLTKGDQLQSGEYRSHLYFRALHNQKALGEEDIKKDSTTISIKIVPVFGITIPVIIRVGESTTTLTITDIKLETADDGIKKILFTIHRDGNMSVLGNISISHLANNKKETPIGLVKGIAIYTPNPLRRLKVDLDNNSSVDFGKGTIRISFLSESDIHPEKLAEAELAL